MVQGCSRATDRHRRPAQAGPAVMASRGLPPPKGGGKSESPGAWMLQSELSLGVTCPATACKALDSWFGIFTAIKAFRSRMTSEGGQARSTSLPAHEDAATERSKSRTPPQEQGEGHVPAEASPPPGSIPAAPEHHLRWTVLCTLVGACFTMKRSSYHTVPTDYPLMKPSGVHHRLVLGVETFHKSR